MSFVFSKFVTLLLLLLKIDECRPKLKAIAASASNTWGLFWLVLLLGYGLVDIPRSVWHSALPGPLLTRLYFKAAKLHAEKSEAEENLEDYLDALQVALNRISPSDPLRKNVETISDKLPTEWREHMKRKTVNANQMNSSDLDEKALVRLHRQVNLLIDELYFVLIRASRILNLYYLLPCRLFEPYNGNIGQIPNGVIWLTKSLIWRTFIVMLGAMNVTSNGHLRLREISGQLASFILPLVRTTNVYNFCDYFYFSLLTDIAVVVAEWYWKCLFRRYLCQALAAVLALLSVLVVWSELTFFNAQPVLSLFAIFVNLAKEYYDYLSIEVSYSVDSVVLFVLRFNLCFSLCSSCCQSPRSPICASALIQRC